MTPVRLRQLEAFHGMLQTGSVTRTAELLSLSQPGISKLLHALEVETGLKLFSRERRRLIPTAEAHRLHAVVEKMFESTRRVDQMAHDILNAGLGELRVVALPMFGLGLLPLVLARMRRRHAGLRVSLSVESSQQVMTMLRAEQADVGFTLPLADGTLPRAGTFALPGLAVLPSTHVHAHRRVLSPADLAGDVFISLGRGYRARDLVDGLFEAHGIARKLEIETQNALAACELAVAGAGVTVADCITAAQMRGRAAVVPITPSVSFQVEAVLPLSGSASGLVRELLQLTRDAVDQAVAESTVGPARVSRRRVRAPGPAHPPETST